MAPLFILVSGALMNGTMLISIEDPDVIGVIGSGARIWAIAAIHGRYEAIKALHALLEPKLGLGDRLVYTGNYMGRGTPEGIRGTLDEIIRFRRRFIARKGAEPHDVQYVRGAQEEMWSKMLQLQLANDPKAVMSWMLKHGAGETLAAYGGTPEKAMGWCREGVMSLTRWTGALRQSMKKHPGHFELFKSLKRAVRTSCNRLLFVHADIDPTRPLEMQGDGFWWDAGGFRRIEAPYEGFERVIRGYTHKGHGLSFDNPFTATIDGGCGTAAALLGGTLNAVCFAPGGEVLDVLSVSERGEDAAAGREAAPSPKRRKPR